MLIRQFLSFIISLLPGFDTPDSILKTFDNVSQIAGFVNYYLPIDAFVTCIVSFVVFSFVCFFISTILKLF